jgi:hypothetical protein
VASSDYSILLKGGGGYSAAVDPHPMGFASQAKQSPSTSPFQGEVTRT